MPDKQGGQETVRDWERVRIALKLLEVAGPQVKQAVGDLIQFDPNRQRATIISKRAAPLLDTGGYIIEENYGLPEGAIGAGGGPKPPLVADDTSVPAA